MLTHLFTNPSSSDAATPSPLLLEEHTQLPSFARMKLGLLRTEGGGEASVVAVQPSLHVLVLGEEHRVLLPETPANAHRFWVPTSPLELSNLKQAWQQHKQNVQEALQQSPSHASLHLHLNLALVEGLQATEAIESLSSGDIYWWLNTLLRLAAKQQRLVVLHWYGLSNEATDALNEASPWQQLLHRWQHKRFWQSLKTATPMMLQHRCYHPSVRKQLRRQGLASEALLLQAYPLPLPALAAVAPLKPAEQWHPLFERLGCETSSETGESPCVLGVLGPVAPQLPALLGLLESLATLPPRFKLLILGGNEGSEAERIFVAKVEALGLQSQVLLTGKVCSGALPAWLGFVSVALLLPWEASTAVSPVAMLYWWQQQLGRLPLKPQLPTLWVSESLLTESVLLEALPSALQQGRSVSLESLPLLSPANLLLMDAKAVFYPPPQGHRLNDLM